MMHIIASFKLKKNLNFLFTYFSCTIFIIFFLNKKRKLHYKKKKKIILIISTVHPLQIQIYISIALGVGFCLQPNPFVFRSLSYNKGKFFLMKCYMKKINEVYHTNKNLIKFQL